MAVQTTYEIAHVGAVAGAVIDGQLKNIQSAAAGEIIPFGKFVHGGGTGEIALLPTTTGQVTGGAMLGVAIRVQDDVANANDVLEYADESDVSVLDFGVVWLVTEDAVVPGDDVFVRFVAGGLGLGSVRSDADTADAVALPGATFVGAAGIGELVAVKVRL